MKATNAFWWQISWGDPTGSATIFCQNHLLLVLWVSAPIKTHRRRVSHPEKRLAYTGSQTSRTGSGQEIYASKSTLDYDNYSIRHNSQTKFLPIHG
jgi:hypothetical protein